MKCFSLFQVSDIEWGISDSFRTDLLQRIVILLQDKGMECSCPQRGTGCIGTAVKQGDAALRVNVFAVQQLRGSTAQSWVWCHNHIPYWKRLLKLVAHASLYSGKALEELCTIVREALESESRLQDIKWLTPAEHVRAHRELYLETIPCRGEGDTL